MPSRSYIAPEIADLVEQELPLDEFLRRINAPLSAEEVEEVERLCSWFTRRYPTVIERMAYVTRSFRAWTRPPIVRRRTDEG